MVAVRVMQVFCHEIIRMITVWDRRMTAGAPVGVVGRVFTGSVTRRATHGIGGAHGDRVFIRMPGVRAVQMAFVHVINVTCVIHREVAAVGAVGVVMAAVRRVMRRAGSCQQRNGNEQGESLLHDKVFLFIVNWYSGITRQLRECDKHPICKQLAETGVGSVHGIC